MRGMLADFAPHVLLLAGFLTLPAEAAETIWRGEARPCGAEAQVRLHFEIAGVRSAGGNLTITVYGDDPAEFLAPGGRLARIRVPSQAGILKACMAVPPRTSYAIAVYHDEDGDHDFGRTLLGLPDEGFGFSRNPDTSLGRPGYESVKFEAGIGDTNVTVSLRYP